MRIRFFLQLLYSYPTTKQVACLNALVIRAAIQCGIICASPFGMTLQKKIFSAVATAFFLSSLSISFSARAEEKKESDSAPKRKVMIIATGGTIAGKQASQS